MAEERLKQTHNRLDKMEDTADFYEYDSRWVWITGPSGRNLMVLSPVYRSRNEKIVAGPIPGGFDGQVRLPKRTQRAVFSPIGSVSVCRLNLQQPYMVHVRNEASRPAYIRITCIGSGSGSR